MKVEIVTPEATLYNGTVTSLAVPGVDGEFEILENHAPIVSLLKEGFVKLFGEVTIDKRFTDKFQKGKDRGMWLPIESGTIELKDNKIVVLAD
ncbi:hypothetical protein [Aegicerativicinus sediminis]|uniref:hypothetical protein n=1 Tax=Aegicerativicinus sediminis TaxID=2893202 RepID=UPI001E2A7DCF|nr:hypothetical protein [Aegicerativicinus sediminis]